MSRPITPVVMCGGSGTRLWPASRESMPKQFIALAGELSTFQETLLRLSDPALFAPPIVLTHDDFRFLVAEQAKAVDVACQIVLEPVRRDSGPAVAVGALLAGENAPDTVVLMLAADHSISDVKAFKSACRKARAAAERDYIVTFGIEPTGPATGYGYIRPGKPVTVPNGATKKGKLKKTRSRTKAPARVVKRFHEKPDSKTAKEFVADGYLWNSGNFVFRPEVMLEEMEGHAPGIVAAVRPAVEQASVDLDFIRLNKEHFSQAPQISLDHAVMEKTERAAVVPARFGWSDIGSWEAVWSLSPHDDHGNGISGPGHTMDANNNLIRSEDGVVTAVVGLDDVVVVSTADAVLVTSRANAEQVKPLVDSLKQAGVACAVEHNRGYRPWGYYERVDRGDRYQVKRIVVKPGGALSLQRHHHRSEHWVVVNGTAEVTRDETVTMVHENQSIYLPQGCVHRLVNPGKIPLHLIEVQVGSYLGEDDIVRLEDAYNRETEDEA